MAGPSRRGLCEPLGTFGLHRSWHNNPPFTARVARAGHAYIPI
jgi:hypothetical protein